MTSEPGPMVRKTSAGVMAGKSVEEMPPETVIVLLFIADVFAVH